MDLLLELESAAFDGRIGVVAGAEIGSVELQLGNILRAQYASLHGREALLSILSAPEGKWILEPGAVEDGSPIVASVSTLLTRGTSRRKYWDKLCANAPSMASVLRLSDAGVRIRDVPSDPLNALLQLIDGRVTLSLLLESSQSDPVLTLEQVIDAIACGLVLPDAPRISLFPLADREPSVTNTGTVAREEEPDVAETGVLRKRDDRAIPSPSRRTANSNAAPDESTSGQSSTYTRRFVGPYEILTQIGHGDRATVYLCRSQSKMAGFPRYPALKLFRSHEGDIDQATQEFLSVTRAGHRIHHPNVVGVLDAGFHENQPYLVMDYVEGCNLSQLAGGNSGTSTRLLIPVMLQALAGLHAVHSLAGDSDAKLKLIHGNVSPENLLVGTDGRCRLTDFGIARRTNYTTSDTTPGKLDCRAPEQLAGHTIDHRADLFAMGVVLWNALTGRRLSAGYTQIARMTGSAGVDFPPPSMVGSTCSSEIDRIVLRALAVNPNVRYDSANDLLMELRAAASEGAGMATAREIGAWVRDTVGNALALRCLTALDMSHATGHSSHYCQPSRIPLSEPSSIQDLPIPLTRISYHPRALNEGDVQGSRTTNPSAENAQPESTPEADQGTPSPINVETPHLATIEGVIHTDSALDGEATSPTPVPENNRGSAHSRLRQGPSRTVIVALLVLACLLGYSLGGSFLRTPANEGTTVGSPKK